jgi:septal ring factor EnvC (AmiA/AmiB activator)
LCQLFLALIVMPPTRQRQILDSEWQQGFEQALATLGREVEQLQTRYRQVCYDQQREQTLAHQIESLRQQRSSEVKAQLKTLQDELERLRLDLESQLFSWDGLKELFWQVLRFGGLGVVLGWVLCAWTR